MNDMPSPMLFRLPGAQNGRVINIHPLSGNYSDSRDWKSLLLRVAGTCAISRR